MALELKKRSEGVSRIELVELVGLGFESGSLVDMGIEPKRPVLGPDFEVLLLRDDALAPNRLTDGYVDVSLLGVTLLEEEDMPDEGVDFVVPIKPPFEGVWVDGPLEERAEFKSNRLLPVDFFPA